MFYHRIHESYEQTVYHVPPMPLDLGFGVHHFGEQVSKPSFRFSNVFGSCCVHVNMEGEGAFTVDGDEYQAGPGSVIVFFPGQTVLYRCVKAPWRYYWVHVEGEHAVELLRACGYDKATPMVVNGALARKDMVFERLKQAMSADGAESTSFESMRAAAELLQLFAIRPGGGRPPPDIAERARRFVDGAELAAVRVGELADMLGVCRSTLFRHFKAKYGITLKSYIEDGRMRRARDLLVRHSMSIAEVADSCGYATKRQFHQAFVQFHRETPGECRVRHPSQASIA